MVVPPLLGLLYLGYFLFSLPLRRQERARLLLDVIETGIERGESPERVVLGAAAQRERKLGKPFRQLAFRLEEGLRFGEALELTRAWYRHRSRPCGAGPRWGTCAKCSPAAGGCCGTARSRCRMRTTI